MILSLLTLTMPSRTEYLKQLKANLGPQLGTGTEWLIRACDPSISLGGNRELLRTEAAGKYIAFIDDDDCVSYDYISSILPLCDGTVDQIGFNVRLYLNGVPNPKLSYQSLRYADWYDDATSGFYRDITHINPMRRELALTERMEGGHGEDKRWADRMRGKVKTEHYIDKVLYFYLFRSDKSNADKCPRCGSDSTVALEDCSACNRCGFRFTYRPPQKSCLWK